MASLPRMPHHTKKGPAFLLVLSCAVGETRTRTGLRPLPPQSSVSTISPPPLEFGIAKVRQKSELPNFSEKIFSFCKDFSTPSGRSK